MPTSDAPRRLGLVVAGCTDVGQVRERNEDAYLIAALADPRTVNKGETGILTITESPACLIVADGVGGSASGEVASLLALETMAGHLRRKYTEGTLRSIPDTARAILKAVAITNQAVYTYAQNHPEHQGMATTITLALTYSDAILVAQIGDSRAYLVHQGVARQLTKDQSLVQQLIDIGELTEAEAARSSHRNIILQALGSEPVVLPDLYCVTAEAGDMLVLCSDGLSNYLGLSDFESLTTASADVATICTQLVDRANARGGDDNITVIAGRFEAIEGAGATEGSLHPGTIMPESTSPTLADRMRRWLR